MNISHPEPSVGGLTCRIYGVQGRSPGSDKASDPLQLSVTAVILEDHVVGEVDIANWFVRLVGRKAGHQISRFDVAPFIGDALGDWALVVCHVLCVVLRISWAPGFWSSSGRVFVWSFLAL